MGAHGWSDDSGIVRHGEAALEAGPTCRMSVSCGSQKPLAGRGGALHRLAGRPVQNHVNAFGRVCAVRDCGLAELEPRNAGLVSGLSWSRVAVLGVGGGFFGVAE